MPSAGACSARVQASRPATCAGVSCSRYAVIVLNIYVAEWRRPGTADASRAQALRGTNMMPLCPVSSRTGAPVRGEGPTCLQCAGGSLSAATMAGSQDNQQAPAPGGLRQQLLGSHLVPLRPMALACGNGHQSGRRDGMNEGQRKGTASPGAVKRAYISVLSRRTR